MTQRIHYVLDKFELRKSLLDSLLDSPALASKIAVLLCKFWTVFAHDQEVGRCDVIKHVIKHVIHITPGPPINIRPRPINPNREKSLLTQVHKWLDLGLVEHSTSPYNFTLVGVPKKCGKIRWCVDYRNLNSRTTRDAHPLPNIFAVLANSKIHSHIHPCLFQHVRASLL